MSLAILEDEWRERMRDRGERVREKESNLRERERERGRKGGRDGYLD